MQNWLSLLHLALLICATSLLGCNTASEAETVAPDLIELEVASELPEGFAEFYETFHTDTAFQIEHIVWPLSGNLRRDTVNQRLVDLRWQRENWVYHKPLDETLGLSQDFDIIGNGLVIERITGSNGNYKIIRRWSQLNKEWHLIYYSASTMGTQ